MPGPDDIQRVAAALGRPGSRYLRRLDEARQTVASRSMEASRQLEVFLDRVGDLTADELRELYAETFRGEASAVRRLLVRLATDSDRRRGIGYGRGCARTLAGTPRSRTEPVRVRCPISVLSPAATTESLSIRAVIRMNGLPESSTRLARVTADMKREPPPCPCC